MNKVKEANVVVSKTKYEQDPSLSDAAEKNKDTLVPVDDTEYKKLVDKSTSSSNASSPTTTTLEETQIDAVIEPQDQETIKYLSNVKDPNTGEISKPFTIDGKDYQMVRGMKPNREVVLGVLCLGEMDEMGGHKIHSVENFEKTIAIPMRERCGGMHSMKPVEEKHNNQDKEKFVDHLNLTDMNGFKHFFVNTHTGDVTAKFKSTKEMLQSGTKLGPDEEYVDAKGLKRFRYKHYFKPEMNEADDETEGTNIDKLKTDVRKLTKLISDKFSVAISKIDKPIEQVEFLSAMAEIIGVPFNKLTSLISSFKDVAGQQKGTEPVPTPAVTTEHKIINKDTLLESLGVKQTITKIKDIKNGK